MATVTILLIGVADPKIAMPSASRMPTGIAAPDEGRGVAVCVFAVALSASASRIAFGVTMFDTIAIPFDAAVPPHRPRKDTAEHDKAQHQPRNQEEIHRWFVCHRMTFREAKFPVGPTVLRMNSLRDGAGKTRASDTVALTATAMLMRRGEWRRQSRPSRNIDR
jgi:hypothetical protein